MPLSLNGHILVLAMAAIAFFSTPLHRTLRAKKPQLQEVPLRVERLQRGLGLHCLRVYEGIRGYGRMDARGRSLQHVLWHLQPGHLPCLGCLVLKCKPRKLGLPPARAK